MPYVFGDCTLDSQRYELRRQGIRIPLRPKVFQVLTYLIEQRHRVVTRDELLAQLRQARDQGQAVLFSSHVLAEVEQVCDRVAILHRGKLAHLQTMAELNNARRVRARFSGPCGPVPALAGLTVREHQDQRLTLEHTGPLPPLLEWLAGQPVADLRVEPIGLAPVQRPVAGFQISTVFCVLARAAITSGCTVEVPPATMTRPSASRQAACNTRGVAMLPVTEKLLVAGS